MNDMQARAHGSVTDLGAFVSKVYMWMAIALAVTGVTSLMMVENGVAAYLAQNSIVYFGLFIVELIMVWTFSSMVQRMSPAVAQLVFLIYSVLNGVTLSILFLVYTGESIATTFFITGGSFALMSAIGFTTKTDLTGFGKLLFMALIGFILATIVNIFLQSSGLYWIITYVMIAIFLGLIAYETQQIKLIGSQAHSDEDRQKLAIHAALGLYLSFINLFILLLRLFGDRD